LFRDEVVQGARLKMDKGLRREAEEEVEIEVVAGALERMGAIETALGPQRRA
jgi:hypothetical protein